MVFYLRMGRACAFFSNKLALFAIGAAALLVYEARRQRQSQSQRRDGATAR